MRIVMTSREDRSTALLSWEEGVDRAARLTGFSRFFVANALRKGERIVSHLKTFEKEPHNEL